MNWVLTNSGCARRVTRILLVGLLFALSVLIAPAYTPVQFGEFRSQLTNGIATLSGLENPTREERSLLRTLTRANAVFTKISVSDGKTLRKLNAIVSRRPAYAQSVTNVASNLLAQFNNEHAFIGGLLLELPPTPDAEVVAAHYEALAPYVARLNAATNVAKFAAIYDAMKIRLDNVFVEANRALIVPFPLDLQENTVKARINGVNFAASSGSSTENEFSAIVSETNIIVTVHAVQLPERGVYFSVPNAQPGTFRYVIPESAVFTNRTDIDFFSRTETRTAATSGTIFISTTPTEVFGLFSCSGPDFEVTLGRFRITISSQP